jgi:hypothetical protein
MMLRGRQGYFCGDTFKGGEKSDSGFSRGVQIVLRGQTRVFSVFLDSVANVDIG